MTQTKRPTLQGHMTPYSEQVGGDHYRTMKIQPMQFCMENGFDFATSNVIKYVTRRKGDADKRAEDLRKAIQCIHIIAAHEGIEL